MTKIKETTDYITEATANYSTDFTNENKLYNTTDTTKTGDYISNYTTDYDTDYTTDYTKDYTTDYASDYTTYTTDFKTFPTTTSSKSSWYNPCRLGSKF